MFDFYPAILNKLESLRKLPYKFYPTGSQVFHLEQIARAPQDLDFFVQDDLNVDEEEQIKKDSQLRKDLEGLGYKKLSSSTYNDSSVTDVYRLKKFQDSNLCRGIPCTIDIQIVNNAELKNHAQDIILEEGLLKFTNPEKEETKIIWNTVLAVLKNISVHDKQKKYTGLAYQAKYTELAIDAVQVNTRDMFRCCVSHAMKTSPIHKTDKTTCPVCKNDIYWDAVNKNWATRTGLELD